MTSKIEHVVLNGNNYVIWVTDMETLLKRKGLWQFTKNTISNPIDANTKFVIDIKKEDAVGIIMTYI